MNVKGKQLGNFELRAKKKVDRMHFMMMQQFDFQIQQLSES